MAEAARQRGGGICLLVCLLLWTECSILHLAEGSFGNLVESVESTSDISEGETKYLYESGPSCVMFSSRNRPFFDVRLGSDRSFRTMLMYLPQGGIDHGHITVTSLIDSTKLNFTRYMEVNGQTVTIWRGDIAWTEWIRVLSAQSPFSVCLIKVYDVTLEDYCECGDQCHRNADVICNGVCSPVDQQTCHRRNVALHRITTMSSSHRESNASYAVNGITGTTFSAPGYTNDSSQWNCIHTGSSDKSPYWQVDLGQEYTVKSLIIYRRPGDVGKGRMMNVKVTVDGKDCYEIRSVERDEKMHVICENPAPRGRIVKLTRNDASSVYGPSINLCEVQIWVCKQGYYGFSCNSECSEGCAGMSNDCDEDSGYCTHGCDDGWYLETCSQKCSGGCGDGRCNRTNGHCSPCRENWTGDRCEECDRQHYGDDCSKKCGHCYDQEPCERDGVCPKDYNKPRCMDGYRGRYCNMTCEPGTYGPDCTHECGKGCSESECDGFTGHCECKHGWKDTDPFCKTRCDWGTYGKNCSNTCGGGCQNTNGCDRTTGHCLCTVGYQPPLCKNVCDAKTYGQNCTSRCGEGCKDGLCQPKSGHCDCSSGWKVDDSFCRTKCDVGFYGNCSTECGHCATESSCHHVTGHCPLDTCEEGYTPPLCAVKLIQDDGDSSGGSNVGTIIGVVIAVLIIIAVVVLVIVIRKRRVRGDKKPLTVNSEEAEGRVYANTGGAPIVLNPRAEGAGVEAFYVNRASTAKDPGDEEEEDEDLLDITEEESEVLGDERWSVYQSIKVALDPLQQQLLDRLADTDRIREEFKDLPAGLCKPYTIGSLEENKPKNRFKRLFPYDHTRVILTPLSGDPSSDYINASYIRNLHDEQAYIATQGPLQSTVGDFWRMVWQENVTQIVMLTNIQEKDKAKCHQYWPEKGERMKHYDITIEGADVQLRADFYVRSFLLRKAKTSAPREVTQYHMVVWPDHGVPSALALVNLQRYVSARTDPSSGPLLVHCSAGVGRTGTYMALDMLMQEMAAQRQVDVLRTVTRMREDRVIMIQTVDQYVFLHEVLLEAYTSRDTRVKVEELDRVFPTPVNTKTENTRIDREFKNLCQMRNFLSKQTYTLAELDENKAKNRDPNIMADDAHLVYLSVHVAGRNQYINAVSVPSFRQQRGMLLTQLPLAETAVDFWRLVEGFNVATVVSLGSSEEEKKKDYCHYWPRVEKNTTKAGPYVIKMTSSESLGETLMSYNLLVERTNKLSRKVRLFHLSDWAAETPGRTSDVLHLLGMLDAVQSQDQDTPIVVQCRDGARKSGLLCALINQTSRLTYDRELDVYLTVRHVQNARPQAVTSKAQYRYCYQVALEYKQSFDVYANS